jgi:hypothetical protein
VYALFAPAVQPAEVEVAHAVTVTPAPDTTQPDALTVAVPVLVAAVVAVEAVSEVPLGTEAMV